MDYIYAVAVSTRPAEWVIYCEICDDNIGNHSSDDIYLDTVEVEHAGFHGLDTLEEDTL